MSEENLSRRALLTRAGAVGAAVLVPPAAVDAIAAQSTGRKAPHPATPKAGLHLLQGGNKRYRVEAIPASQRTLDACISSNASNQAADPANRDAIIKPAIRGALWVVPAVCNVANGRVRLVAPPVMPSG